VDKLEQQARRLEPILRDIAAGRKNAVGDRWGLHHCGEAADLIAALSQQRAVPEVTDEMVEIVGKQLWRYWGDVKGAAARTYRNKTRKALEDALATAPSPEQEK